MRYIALIIAASCATSSAEAELTIKATPGAGGYVRASTFLPVNVQLLNDDESRDGQVVVRAQTMGGDSVSARRNVELPPRSQKSVWLYLPLGESLPQQLQVQYVMGRWRSPTLRVERVQPVRSDVPVIAVVGDMPRGLPTETDDGRTLVQTLVISDAMLPDRYEGLEMYDAMILATPMYQPLPRAAAQAILEWVARGGTLIVDASEPTDGLRSGLLASELPYTPTTVGQAALPGSGGREVLHSRGERHGGKILRGNAELPLVMRKRYGMGTITCTASTIEDYGVGSGGPDLWKELLSALEVPWDGPADDSMSYYRSEAIGELERLVARNSPPGNLRLGLVLLLTLIYTLAVGPGDYFLVKKLGRPHLTWVTFPLIVAIFTLAAYAGARAWVGGETSTTNVRRVFIFPEDAIEVEYDLVSIFTGSGANYRLATEAKTPLYPIRPYFDLGARLTADHDTGTLEYPIAIWQNRTFATTRMAEKPLDIEFTLEPAPAKSSFTIVNNSDIRFNLGGVLSSDQFRGISELPGPGESRTYSESDLRLSSMSPAMNILTRRQNEQSWRWPPGRQLNTRSLLEQNAVILVMQATNAVDNPLTVNGLEQKGKGDLVVLIIAEQEDTA